MKHKRHYTEPSVKDKKTRQRPRARQARPAKMAKVKLSRAGRKINGTARKAVKMEPTLPLPQLEKISKPAQAAEPISNESGLVPALQLYLREIGQVKLLT